MTQPDEFVGNLLTYNGHVDALHRGGDVFLLDYHICLGLKCCNCEMTYRNEIAYVSE